jgi:hypothetical protein
MSADTSKEEANKMLFANLVMMLSSSVMQELGKLVNPLSKKVEINLEAAQVTIDMLDMIKDKTKGNLDKDEESMLTSMLSSLQMNYVETAETAAKSEKPVAEKAGTPPEPSATGQKSDKAEAPNPPPPGTEAKEPKYRKSYGA